MAVALVDKVAAQATSGGDITTGSIDTTGANFLVMGVSFYQNVTANPTITDSKGNTWTPLTRNHNTNYGDYVGRIYYVENPTVGSGHTFSSAGPSVYSTISVGAFSGLATSSVFVDEEVAITGGMSVTTLSAASLATGADEILAVSHLALREDSGGGTISINDSFTVLHTFNNNPGNALGLGFAYRIEATPSTVIDPTWTFPTDSAATELAFFVAGAGGGGGGGRPYGLIRLGVM